jgi:ankyrin repeat protein
VLKVLLEHGAPCDVATATGKTPLHGAALYGHGSVARMLLEFKADKELDGWGGLWKIHQVRQYLCNVYIYILCTCIYTCVQHIM